MHVYFFGVITMLFAMNPANGLLAGLYIAVLLWLALSDSGVLFVGLMEPESLPEGLIKEGIPILAMILYTFFFIPAVCQQGFIKWIGLSGYVIHFLAVCLINQKFRLLRK